ncbi:MAG: hypothetical protein ACXV3S_11180 [Kineosporiaceae bacterium]
MEGSLAGLPGASSDAGEGPVVDTLLEGLLLAAGFAPDSRRHARAWYADLLGPLLVSAGATAALQDDLEAADHGLRIALVAEPGPGDPAGLHGLREARNRLLDDDRLELTGVHLLLPADVPPDAGVHALLGDLDFTVPAWIELTPAPGWEPALAALAADGAERLAVRLPPDGESAHGVARVLRGAVDRDLSLRVVGAGPAAATTRGALAALCGVRAALNGAEAPEIAAILAEQDLTPLSAALRRMSEADAAVARVFLDGVVVAGIDGVVGDLTALGLISGG